MTPLHRVDRRREERARCVVVADHDPSVRHLAARVLGGRGFRVLAAFGAGEALELLERERDCVDLLLVDLAIPGSSGPELARRARSLHPDLRVLYLSAYSERALRKAELTHPFLAKPLRSEELEAAVVGILNERSFSASSPSSTDP